MERRTMSINPVESGRQIELKTRHRERMAKKVKTIKKWLACVLAKINPDT